MARTLNYTPGAPGTFNLQTVLRAAGFKDISGLVDFLHIFNPSAATDVYVHLTADGVTAPGTGTDGWPIGASATAVEKTFKYTKGDQRGGLDVNTTWLHFPAAVPIKILVDGI
jgi:hypothetical protein